MESAQTAPVQTEDDVDASDRFSAYTQHASVLRTWLVAYGIGAPVLFLSQNAVWLALAKAGELKSIARLFLMGVFLQVILSALNKSVMWATYYGDITPSFRSNHLYSCADSLSKQYWIDFLIDIISIALFCVATYRCFSVLSAVIPGKP